MKTPSGRVDGRVAVTGAAGFIGSRLVASLTQAGAEVVPLEGDVLEDRTWDVEFDLLYHLASALPEDFARDPGRAFAVNVDGVRRALEASRRCGASLVFPSSAGVYAADAPCPLSESSSPLAPRTPYPWSKLLGEELCRAYAESCGVRTVVLRLFNVYGSGQRPSYLLPYLAACARDGVPARLRHPDSTRDFVHVADVVAALRAAPACPRPFAVYNVGSGTPTTVRRIVELVEQVAGRPLRFERCPDGPDPIPASVANVALAAQELGWKPNIALAAGLTEVVRREPLGLSGRGRARTSRRPGRGSPRPRDTSGRA